MYHSFLNHSLIEGYLNYYQFFAIGFITVSLSVLLRGLNARRSMDSLTKAWDLPQVLSISLPTEFQNEGETTLQMSFPNLLKGCGGVTVWAAPTSAALPRPGLALLLHSCLLHAKRTRALSS